MELLIAKGADVNARDNESSATPLHYAASWGRNQAIEILLKHGAGISVEDKSRTNSVSRCAGQRTEGSSRHTKRTWSGPMNVEKVLDALTLMEAQASTREHIYSQFLHLIKDASGAQAGFAYVLDPTRTTWQLAATTERKATPSVQVTATAGKALSEPIHIYAPGEMCSTPPG